MMMVDLNRARVFYMSRFISKLLCILSSCTFRLIYEVNERLIISSHTVMRKTPLSI